MFGEPPAKRGDEWADLMRDSAPAKDVLALAAHGERPAKLPWAPGRKSVTVQEAAGWVSYWTEGWQPEPVWS